MYRILYDFAITLKATMAAGGGRVALSWGAGEREVGSG